MMCRINLKIGELRPEDLKIEMVFVSNEDNGQRPKLAYKLPFIFEVERNGIFTFKCDESAQRIGVWDCAIHMIPNHDLLPHDQDFNVVRWF